MQMFERIRKLYEYQGFNSLNDFSLNGLGYSSPQKLNRLKDPKKKPSYDILVDILTKFREVNARWLILGDGPMISNKYEASEPMSTYGTAGKDQIIEMLRSKIEDKEEIILLLKRENEMLRKNAPKSEREKQPRAGRAS